MKIEVWKDIRGYEGIYQISSLGKVKRLETQRENGCGNYHRKEHLISVSDRGNGYLRCHLSKNGITKNHAIHRLVAEAFIPNMLNLKTVNHINEEKKDNRAANLEWATMQYQNTYGKASIKRRESNKKPIIQYDMNGNFIKSWDGARDAAKELGLLESSICSVCKGARRYKSTGGYKFKYKNNCSNSSEEVLNG